MRLVILAVGRDRRGPSRALFDHYAGRIRRIGPGLGFRGFDLVEIAEGRGSAGPRRREIEGEAIIGALSAPCVAALDERGDDVTSADLARWLERERDGGTEAMAFVIGGADGLCEAVRARADRTIAFGRATWPHLMVRAMLAEQIYRVLTILGRHPYHRD